MSRMPKLRRSPAMLVAIIALVAALGGSAFAVGGLTGKQKKQVRKIATKVFNKQIGGASVAHASSADTASSAKTANSAKTADTAKKATDAEKLGGLPASKYQQVIQSACPKNGAYEAIGSDGSAACVIPVQPIVMSPAAGELKAQQLGAGLQLLTICHDGANVKMAFQNLGSSGATLNWFFSDGTTVSATGNAIGGGGEDQFDFSAKRIEGQFIWSVGAQVITVNLHAFDGGAFCEVRGTAEGATA